MNRIPISKTEFEDLLSYQCTKEDIAGFFHVSEKTIARFCQREYQRPFSEIAEEYKASGRVSLRRAQYASAIGGNVQMQIFLGKQWLNQTDKITQDVEVRSNEPQVVIYKHESQWPFDRETHKDPEPDQDPADDDHPDPEEVNPEDFEMPISEEAEAAITEKIKRLLFDTGTKKRVKSADDRVIMAIGMKSLMETREYFFQCDDDGTRPFVAEMTDRIDRMASEKFDINLRYGNGCSCSEHFHATENSQICTLCQSCLNTSEKCLWETSFTFTCACDPRIRDLADRYRESNLIRKEIDMFLDKNVSEDTAFSYRNILQRAVFVTEEDLRQLTEAEQTANVSS